MNVEALEQLAKDAAENVSRFLPGSHTENDGGGEYIRVPVKCQNEGEYVIAFVPTLDNGATAKWSVQNNEHNWSWDSESMDASANPERVAVWIQSCVEDCASKVYALAG